MDIIELLIIVVISILILAVITLECLHPINDTPTAQSGLNVSIVETIGKPTETDQAIIDYRETISKKPGH